MLKDYLPYYLGCKVWDTKADKGEEISTIESIDIKRDFVYDNFGNEIPFNELKLLLRPLNSMMEEELIDIIQLTIPDDFEDRPDSMDYDMKRFYNDGGNMVDDDVAIGADIFCICYVGQVVIRNCGSLHFFDTDGKPKHVYNMPRVIHYLLSKHFDIFNLIHEGLALLK